ncbi:MAG: hypothetical protein LUQ65_12575 [Candidatus Helarchaeota archaeon]|nr:hypothetical protein [Candidatus Helarchaeota archaeon]
MKFKKPHPIPLGKSADQAIYCANCKNFEQDIIGSKIGCCMEHTITDATCPMKCPAFQNEIRIISVLIYLSNGITIYNKAVVQDLSTQIDPDLLSSFLDAINMFGKDITQEEVSQIQFQKINILISRAQYSYGALLLKGKIDDLSKQNFSNFLLKIEDNFQDYFKGPYIGQSLPENEVDLIAFSSLKAYLSEKLYNISPEIIKKSCFLKKGMSKSSCLKKE